MSETRRKFVTDVNRAIGVDRTASQRQTDRFLRAIETGGKSEGLPQTGLIHNGMPEFFRALAKATDMPPARKGE